MRVASSKAPLLWIEVAAAVARHRADTMFVVVGDGPLLGDMKDAAARLGLLPNFRFTGAVADVYSLFPGFDVFLLTSISEGVPNVLIEAQASGVPVVARNVGAVRDAMRPGRTGQVVEDSDPSRLAAAVITYLNDPELAKRSGREAEAFARECHDVEHMIDQIQKLVET
jgi:glycosyltransferase involved in cell wall biosynthesis